MSFGTLKRKTVWRSQPSLSGIGINKSNGITRGLTLALIPGSIKPQSRITTETDQVGLSVMDGNLGYGSAFIETDTYDNINNDGGSMVSSTEVSLLYFGMMRDAGTVGDKGLIGNRSVTGSTWNVQMQTKQSDGINPSSIQFYTLDGIPTEYIAVTSDNFLTSTPQAVIAIGTAKQGDDVRIWAKKRGAAINTGNNGGSCQMQSTTDDIALNGYFDFAASRMINGEFDGGGCALACVWNRQLHEREVLSLLDNPWQIFEPKTIFIPLELPDPNLVPASFSQTIARF